MHLRLLVQGATCYLPLTTYNLLLVSACGCGAPRRHRWSGLWAISSFRTVAKVDTPATPSVRCAAARIEACSG